MFCFMIKCRFLNFISFGIHLIDGLIDIHSIIRTIPSSPDLDNRL